MLLDVTNRKAGTREFCGCRQARDSATDNEDVEDLYATYDAIEAPPSDCPCPAYRVPGIVQTGLNDSKEEADEVIEYLARL